MDVDKGKVAYRECLVWALELLTRAHARGELAPVQLVEMQAKVLALQAHLTSLYHWQWQVMPFIYMHLVSTTTAMYMLLCARPRPSRPATCACTHRHRHRHRHVPVAHAHTGTGTGMCMCMCMCPGGSACPRAMQARDRQGVALHAHRQLHLRRDHASK